MDYLFIASNGLVACIHPQTGQEIWRTTLNTGGFLSSRTYDDVSVLEDNGYVFAGTVGHLFCLDARTGKQLWHNSLEGFGYNDVSMCINGKYISTKSPEKE